MSYEEQEITDHQNHTRPVKECSFCQAKTENYIEAQKTFAEFLEDLTRTPKRNDRTSTSKNTNKTNPPRKRFN